MDFTVQHFSNCFYNPLHPKFWESATRMHGYTDEKMLKWIVMMYDPKSPLLKEYGDFGARKEKSYSLTGYKHTGDEAETKAVVHYLKIVKSRLWASIVAIETAIWEHIDRLMSPIVTVGAGADKDKVAAVNMKATTAEGLVTLNEMYETQVAKFCGGDKELEEKVERQKDDVNLSAEMIAKALKGKG